MIFSFVPKHIYLCLQRRSYNQTTLCTRTARFYNTIHTPHCGYVGKSCMEYSSTTDFIFIPSLHHPHNVYANVFFFIDSTCVPWRPRTNSSWMFFPFSITLHCNIHNFAYLYFYIFLLSNKIENKRKVLNFFQAACIFVRDWGTTCVLHVRRTLYVHARIAWWEKGWLTTYCI